MKAEPHHLGNRPVAASQAVDALACSIQCLYALDLFESALSEGDSMSIKVGSSVPMVETEVSRRAQRARAS